MLYQLISTTGATDRVLGFLRPKPGDVAVAEPKPSCHGLTLATRDRTTVSAASWTVASAR